ncbi:MAG: DUF3438 family protein [Emcibacter sp.]|nr:DUF3438 family protein [Emcibacter sp.]MBL4894967.1 DUF3438 family protein [Emcibacter sp.]
MLIKKSLQYFFCFLALVMFSGVVVTGDVMAKRKLPKEVNTILESLEFKDAKVLDAIRILSELSNVNIIATKEAAERTVSLYVTKTTVKNAIDGLCRVSGLWYRYNQKSSSYLIMTADQYKDDIVIYREDLTKVFTLRHQNVETTALIIEAIFGNNRVELNLETDAEGESLEPVFSGNVSGGGGNRSGSSNRSSRNQRNNNRSFLSDRGSNSSSGSSQQENYLLGTNLSTAQIASLNIQEKLGRLEISANEAANVANKEPKIYVTVNKFHNLLFVRTSDERAMTQIEELVEESDRPTPQVLLEMKILELTVGDGFRSAFNFSAASSSGRFRVTGDGEDAVATFIPTVQGGLGNFPSEGGTALFQFLNNNILANIELMASENRIKVLATPLLLASNNKMARLFIGQERVLIRGAKVNTTTGTTGASTSVIELETETRDVGNELQIVPRINSDKSVTLNLLQQTSSVAVASTFLSIPTERGVIQVPIDTLNTSNIRGTVVIKNGLTVAVGGMIRRTKEVSKQKVPILGDIPGLGLLFRREVVNDVQTELILLITPHVFIAAEEGEEISRNRLNVLSANDVIEEFGFEAGTSDQYIQNSDKYIRMTRHAGLIMNGLYSHMAGTEQVEQPLSSPIRFFRNQPVKTQALSSWKSGRHYVTALRVTNLSGEVVKLALDQVAGDWKAVSAEMLELPSAGEGRSTMAYVISDRPFLQALQVRENVKVRLGGGRVE